MTDKASDDTLNNNDVFSLRMRASARGDTSLVKLIDRYLEHRGAEDEAAVRAALENEARPSLVLLLGPARCWRVFELNTPLDLEMLRGLRRPERLIYIRGVYAQDDMRHLMLIEQGLREIVDPLRAGGAIVEWFLHDGKGR